MIKRFVVEHMRGVAGVSEKTIELTHCAAVSAEAAIRHCFAPASSTDMKHIEWDWNFGRTMFGHGGGPGKFNEYAFAYPYGKDLNGPWEG